MIPPPEAVAGTEARDKDGNPLVLYHGTLSPFERFSAASLVSLGFHFGCPVQANHRIGDNVGGRIFPVYLMIANLIDCIGSDLGFENPYPTAYLLKMYHVLTAEEVLSSVGLTEDMSFPQAHAAYPNRYDCQKKNAAMAAALMAKGIDGIRYSNKNEPPDKVGREAYVVFRPNQIFSAITGQCLGGE